jgi:hypothetical protein
VSRGARREGDRPRSPKYRASRQTSASRDDSPQGPSPDGPEPAIETLVQHRRAGMRALRCHGAHDGRATIPGRHNVTHGHRHPPHATAVQRERLLTGRNPRSKHSCINRRAGMRALRCHGAHDGRATVPGRRNIAHHDRHPPHATTVRKARLLTGRNPRSKHLCSTGAQECAPSDVTGRTTGGRPFLVATMSHTAIDIRLTRRQSAIETLVQHRRAGMRALRCHGARLRQVLIGEKL